MEYQQDSFDVENLVFTPTDSGVPMSSTPLPLPPSSHMSGQDVAQSSAQAAGKKTVEQEEFELPDFTCKPTDVELVEDYLRPAIQRMQPEEPTSFMDPWQRRPAVVNADLPCMDPWELPGTRFDKKRMNTEYFQVLKHLRHANGSPGMIAGNSNGKGKGGMMRDKYYLTDHTTLAYSHSYFNDVRTTNGFWHKHAPDTVIISEHNKWVAGVKKTMRFHLSTLAETNWTMNIYYSLNEENSFIRDGLVLCHVFQTDSAPDYDDNPKCLGCHRQAWSGYHHGQELGAPINYSSFNSTEPEYWPMHFDCKLRSDKRLKSFVEQLENLLLSDPDPDISLDAGNSSATRGDPPTANHGQSKKRKKISDVWDYFTKIFARDINGKVVTYAACNHCCKILSASSKNGTSQLARHACPCKFKPVAAGRSAKDSGGDVNVLSS